MARWAWRFVAVRNVSWRFVAVLGGLWRFAVVRGGSLCLTVSKVSLAVCSSLRCESIHFSSRVSTLPTWLIRDCRLRTRLRSDGVSAGPAFRRTWEHQLLTKPFHLEMHTDSRDLWQEKNLNPCPMINKNLQRKSSFIWSSSRNSLSGKENFEFRHENHKHN